MINMYPMDFEEYLWNQANGEYLTNYIEKCFNENIPMDNVTPKKLQELYRKYLIVGGMSEAVKDLVSKDMNILNINKKIINKKILLI